MFSLDFISAGSFHTTIFYIQEMYKFPTLLLHLQSAQAVLESCLENVKFFNCNYTQCSKLLSLRLCSSECCKRLKNSDGANCHCKPVSLLMGYRAGIPEP